MTIKEQLAAEKKKKFDDQIETIGYRNGIECAEIICKTIIDRDEAIKPNDIAFVHCTGCNVGYCPHCAESVSDIDLFCSKCGQRLKWKDSGLI